MTQGDADCMRLFVEGREVHDARDRFGDLGGLLGWIAESDYSEVNLILDRNPEAAPSAMVTEVWVGRCPDGRAAAAGGFVYRMVRGEPSWPAR